MTQTLGHQIKQYGTGREGGVCSTHWREKKPKQNYSQKAWRLVWIVMVGLGLGILCDK